MVRIRQGKIEDFAKLNQEWAWSPHDESQQKAQKDYISGIKAGKQEFWVVEDRGEILGELHLLTYATHKIQKTEPQREGIF